MNHRGCNIFHIVIVMFCGLSSSVSSTTVYKLNLFVLRTQRQIDCQIPSALLKDGTKSALHWIQERDYLKVTFSSSVI